VQWRGDLTAAAVLSTRLSAYVNELPLTVSGDATIKDGGVLLDLATTLGTGAIANLSDLMPLQVMHAHGDQWLRSAFQSGVLGSASLTIKGSVQSFPFEPGKGVFSAKLWVEDTHLRYAAQWPDAEVLAGSVQIDGRRLTGELTAATFLSSPLQHATLEIADVFSDEPVLLVSGTVRASLADALATLRDSPLKQGAVRQLDDFDVSGQFDLGLDLRLGLHEGAERTALGTVTFDGNRVQSARHHFELNDLTGRLSFTHDDWYGEDLTATIGSQRIGLVATGGVGDPNYDTELRITGITEAVVLKDSLAEFAPALHAWFQTHHLMDAITGQAPWKAVISIPRTDDPAPVTKKHLVIESSLQGLALALPAPFGKPAAESSWLKIETEIGGDSPTSRVEFGSTVRALIKHEGGRRLVVRQLDAAFGADAVPALEHPGIHLHGRVAGFKLSDWTKHLRGARGPGALPVRFDLDVAEIETFGQAFRDVHVTGFEDTVAWRIQVESPNAAGEITLPRRADGTPVTLNFERLWLDQPAAAAGKQSALDPREIPALVIACASFKYHEIDLGQAALATVRVATGQQLQSLLFLNAALQLQATGEWVVDSGAQRSRFSIDLKGDKLGPILQTFGYDSSAIRGGKTAIALEAAWPGTPADFTLDRLDGKLGLKVAKGRFLDIEPGSGRLFGLLSLQTLPRRLSFDFADLFQKGFAFDKIDGWFELAAGNAYTNNLFMEGPSAKIEISGRTGLAQKDYDQRAIVTPALSKSIPLASALFGPAGIGVGAAIYLGQKLFKEIPNQVDRFLQKNYAITGSWDDPKVERL
ncbi:MAG: YhdP family protein, partial [Gammaproteobacteria bacterium]